MRGKLKLIADKQSGVLSLACRRLLEWIESGKTTFTRRELTDGIAKDDKQSANIVGHLRLQRIITTKEKYNRKMALYALNVKWLYSPDVTNMIFKLAGSRTSQKDRRIGAMLLRKYEAGSIEAYDYLAMGATNKWAADMKLCEILGIVSRETPDKYVINSELKPRYKQLEKWQKCMASAMYDSFGQERFTSEMILANLDYSEGSTSATLHTFTLMGILDCEEGGTNSEYNSYQFLVTPEECPDCFDIAA